MLRQGENIGQTAIPKRKGQCHPHLPNSIQIQKTDLYLCLVYKIPLYKSMGTTLPPNVIIIKIKNKNNVALLKLELSSYGTPPILSEDFVLSGFKKSPQSIVRTAPAAI